MNPADDSAVGAAVFFYGSLGAATALWLLGHYLGRFHRRGVARLRAHRTRQETHRP
jgi:hypothetical protein